MKHREYVVGICLVILSIGLSAHGQQFWEKKSYEEWSDSEALRMLVDSPWGQIQEPAGDTPMNIRLHSALPIRKALVRLRQIKLNRLKVTSPEQFRIDAEARELLECTDCQKYYIVSVQPVMPNEKNTRGLSKLSFDSLKSYVSLVNDTGAIRPLVKFLPLQTMGEKPLFVRNSLFFFERLDDQGKPLITPANTSFYLTIDKKALKGTGIDLRNVTFRVSRLTQQGQVQF